MERKRVAGDNNTFMRVDHLTLTGSQRDIGRALAREARAGYGWTPEPVRSKAVSAGRRAWFREHWPQQYERMLGAADIIGIDIEADNVHLDGLTGVPQGSGCSAIWSPPASTVEGQGFVGRNYDFFTTSEKQLWALMSGNDAGEDSTPAMSSRPYVVTCRPEDGESHTFITMNNLSGAMEGVNESGLAGALLIADAEGTQPLEDAGPQVGLAGDQVLRFVLETCSNVDEAQVALLGAKQYDAGAPLHFLIADAQGQAFVWERSHRGNEHAIAADGPMCVTNHFLHRHPDPSDLPKDNAESMRTYERAATLTERLQGQQTSGAEVRQTLDDVHFHSTNNDGYPLRTLWRTVMNVHERTMATRFFLGDADDGSAIYSEELVFTP